MTTKQLAFALLIICCLFSCRREHEILGQEVAKTKLTDAITENDEVFMTVRHPIKDKKAAIELAEPILFDYYGKAVIENERPYETYLIDNHWVISGTLSYYNFGDPFVIIISAKDGKIIKMSRGK